MSSVTSSEICGEGLGVVGACYFLARLPGIRLGQSAFVLFLSLLDYSFLITVGADTVREGSLCSSPLAEG